MAYIRKWHGKWQVFVRRKKVRAIKSFLRKGDAVKWAYKTEAQIETGSYLNVKKQERLNEIKLSNLLDIFFDKTNFNLIGWQTIDIYQNLNITYLSSIITNQILKNNLFKLPETN